MIRSLSSPRVFRTAVQVVLAIVRALVFAICPVNSSRGNYQPPMPIRNCRQAYHVTYPIKWHNTTD